MRILISSTEGVGHLQPLLPFAHALRRRGHEVRVSGPPSFRATLAKAGLDHAPVDLPGQEQQQQVLAEQGKLSGDARLELGVRVRFVGMFARTALPGLQETMRTWKPDLVLHESCEYAAGLVAECAGLPRARVAVLNPAAEDFFARVAAEPLDTLRALVGLEPDGGASLRDTRTFTAFPPSFFAAGAESSGKRPFLLREPVETVVTPVTPPIWVPTDNRPMVYITFGTMLAMFPNAQAVYRAALDAMEDLPVHALLTVGQKFDNFASGAIPGNVTVETFIPQAQILPHAAVVLNHGGSGTVLGGLAAGIPMVIAPLFADQPHNARSVERTGVGVAVFTPDAASMRSAVERVLATPAMRDAAGRIAAEIAALPDIEAATDQLLELA